MEDKNGGEVITNFIIATEKLAQSLSNDYREQQGIIFGTIMASLCSQVTRVIQKQDQRIFLKSLFEEIDMKLDEDNEIREHLQKYGVNLGEAD